MCIINHIRYIKLTMGKGKKEFGVEFVHCSGDNTQCKSLTKWGIKVFVLSDATKGYVHQLQIYTEKNRYLDTS